MRIVRYGTEGIETIDSPDWPVLMAQTDGVLWVDMTGPDAEDVRVMQEVFHFHPLAIEDTQNERQRPKVEEYKEHLFIILNPVNPFTDELTFRELNVFATHNAIVSVHAADEPVVEQVRQRCASKLEVDQYIMVGFLI